MRGPMIGHPSDARPLEKIALRADVDRSAAYPNGNSGAGARDAKPLPLGFMG